MVASSRVILWHGGMGKRPGVSARLMSGKVEVYGLSSIWLPLALFRWMLLGVKDMLWKVSASEGRACTYFGRSCSTTRTARTRCIAVECASDSKLKELHGIGYLSVEMFLSLSSQKPSIRIVA